MQASQEQSVQLFRRPSPRNVRKNHRVRLASSALRNAILDNDENLLEVHPEPERFFKGDLDPSQTRYPVPWQPFFAGIIDHWLAHHTPRIPMLDSPGQGFLKTRYFGYCMMEPALFYELILFSYSSLADKKGTLQGEAEQTMVTWLKHQTISTLNRSLRDPKTCVSDLTLLSVSAMATYEFVFGGRDESRKHLKGLQTMSRIRGGIKSPTVAPDISRIIQMIDFNQARVTGDIPLLVDRAFPMTPESESSASTMKMMVSNKNPPSSPAVTLYGFGHSVRDPEIGLALRHLNTIMLGIDDFELDPTSPKDREVIQSECSALVKKLKSLEPRIAERECSVDAVAAATARAIQCARLAALGTCYKVLRRFQGDDANQATEEASLIIAIRSFQGQELLPQYVSVLLWALFMCGQNAGSDDSAIHRMLLRSANFLGLQAFEDIEPVLVAFSYSRSINRQSCQRLWEKASARYGAQHIPDS